MVKYEVRYSWINGNLLGNNRYLQHAQRVTKLTKQHQGTDDTVDSDINPTDGKK